MVTTEQSGGLAETYSHDYSGAVAFLLEQLLVTNRPASEIRRETKYRLEFFRQGRRSTSGAALKVNRARPFEVECFLSVLPVITHIDCHASS